MVNAILAFLKLKIVKNVIMMILYIDYYVINVLMDILMIKKQENVS